MAPGPVSVEEVDGRKELARFVELPQALHGEDPAFAPLVIAWERYRVDARRNPYFEDGEAGFFLARRHGRIVGRIAAHVPAAGGEGRFGFWSVVDDDVVAAELLRTARSWCVEQGCRSMRGPVSFDDGDEPGVLVAGFGSPGRTGRPWQPPHEARLLEACGATAVEEVATWRLPVRDDEPLLPAGGDWPGQAAAYVDQRLVLGAIAAVPDISEALRTAGIREAWSLAKRARTAQWDVAVVVRCSGDPAVLVPAMQVAAGEAGYREVVAPWSPDPSAVPETRHRRYRFEL